ncbi:MAG: hypothetical protein AB7R89_22085 [Dehalococcoidia bacterium]
MPDEAIAAAHERAVEQVMSDEHLLGTLPDDLSQALLDWVIARYDQAAADAPGVDTFKSRADAIRHQARTIADASAEAGDDRAALLARLRAADAVADEARPQPAGDGQPPPTEAAPAPLIESETSGPAPALPAPPPPHAANDDAVVHGTPVARPRDSVAMPKQRRRPSIAIAVRTSLKHAYDRFRALMRPGGAR